jgi:hypothetical protein
MPQRVLRLQVCATMPGLGVFLGRHVNWPFHFEVLFLYTSGQVSTRLLQGLHTVAGEGNSNSLSRHPWGPFWHL